MKSVRRISLVLVALWILTAALPFGVVHAQGPRGGEVKLVTIFVRLEHFTPEDRAADKMPEKFWGFLTLLAPLLTARGQVEIDSRSRTVIITDTAANAAKVESAARELDKLSDPRDLTWSDNVVATPRTIKTSALVQGFLCRPTLGEPAAPRGPLDPVQRRIEFIAERADALKKFVSRLLSPPRTFFFDCESGEIVVYDVPERVRRFMRLIEIVDVSWPPVEHPVE